MNVDRRLPDGTRQESEVVNKSQIYVTTAGWKSSFAYDKLIQLLIQQIIEPKEAVVMGGTWRIPVMEKLLKKSFVQELKLDGTYNDASFAREYKLLICTLKILRIAGTPLNLINYNARMKQAKREC